VNRRIGILAGLAAFGVAAYLGSYLLARQNATGQAAQSPLQTRVALINFAQVIKDYHKFKNYEVGLKLEAEKYRTDSENKRGLALKKQDRLKDPVLGTAEREQLEKEVKVLQHELQDMADEFKERTRKEDFDLMVQMYKEVRDEVAVIAKRYGFELVLQYNDPEPDAFSPPLFQQRLANEACIPMYMHPRMDLTAYVTSVLNGRFQAGTPPVNRPGK
jgi:Skp family chaperone for outer membrane proteins